MRWHTYVCSSKNFEDILASAAKQFVCKYLSRIRVMLNCIMRMTTSTTSPPRLISDNERSVYQLSFRIGYRGK